MELSAEALFDYLGKRYEDAFADSPNLLKFIELANTKLPPNSRVLDVGSGTGRPVAHTLASAGHEVHGIDASGEMVRIASSQVRGSFQKADMRHFTPDGLFHGVLAILSLFQITPGETCSMCTKFAEWLKPGGIVVIGVTPSTSLGRDQYVYDPTWDCALQQKKPWMDGFTNETFFSEDGWRRLLRQAGFEVESEAQYLFTPSDPEHKTAETHFLLLARKVESQPLLGPYPIPLTSANSQIASSPASMHTPDPLVSRDLDALLQSWDCNHQNVLSLGKLYTGEHCSSSGFHYYDGPIERLPFPSGIFDVVMLVRKLDNVTDWKKAFQEVVRASAQGPHSRIVVIQGAPYNEAMQFQKTISHAPPVAHQGRLLQLAMEQLVQNGFGQTSMRRIPAHHVFPEPDIEDRCDAAAKLLAGKSYSAEIGQELLPRLRLHFQGSPHTIGNDMVMLVASMGSA